MKKSLISLAIAGVVACSAMSAYAGAFQLFEQNAAELGDFNAGDAAIAEDASTAWYNAAGMTQLKHTEISVSGDLVFTHIKFTGSSTWSTTLPGVGTLSSTESGVAHGGHTNFIPAFHIVVPCDNDKFAFGFSVAAPFGLETDYSQTAFTRYAATETSLKVIDLSPSFAVKMTPHFSVGLGVDPMYADANLDSVVGTPGVNVAMGLPANATDSLSENSGNAWGIGYHAGVLWNFYHDHTRFGVTYRSQTHFSLQGSSTLTGPLALNATGMNSLTSNNLKAGLNLPATITFSAYQQLTNRWAIMASAINTQWHNLRNLTLENVAGITATGAPTTAASTNVAFRYHNAWRLALGASYQVSPKFLVRFGGGYDESPLPNSTRNIRLPDDDRYALSIGGQYQYSKALSIDVGYTHMFIKDGKVNNPQPIGTSTVTTVGTAKTSGDLVGLQLNYKFV